MDKLTLINMALMKCGLPLAASLNDCDWNAQLMFEQCAGEALVSHAWGFAQKSATLVMDPESPQFGYNYRYRMPEDCLRVLDVRAEHDSRAPKGRFRVQGRYILTNANPCHARYIGRFLDPGDWPPMFCNAVAARIAQEIAGLSAENMAMVPQLLQAYKLALTEAQLMDARESTERVTLDVSVHEQRQQRRERSRG